MENIEELLSVIINNDKNEFENFINDMYPIDVAILLDTLDDENLLKFYKLAEDEHIAEFLEQANEEFQIRFLKLLDLKEIIKLFSYMSNDDKADILGNLPISDEKRFA
ncbi:magnesium transporter MgtE N-terminal domain-containing protein [Clostridium thermarum]|uniref:magnesium transporter MgtE N-terminal domain-containing protein n=1 Tax=Clostridium thermarum TaxID=1716543 RepID=UPI001A9B8452|nr:hypothetical protein [Clostridium thermarum]